MPSGILPQSLWLLVSAWVLPTWVQAQTSVTKSLPLNVPIPLSSSNFSGTNPLLFALPDPTSAHTLWVSIARCSSSQSAAQFFVTNSSAVATPGPDGGTDVFQIDVGSHGFGNWAGPIEPGAGKLAIWGAGASDTVQVGASDRGAFAHLPQHVDTLPFLGDTTSNVAILYSFPSDPPTVLQPTYPNYTLPDADTPFPAPPPNPQRHTLVLSPTSAALANGTQTACALLAAVDPKTNGSIAQTQLWLRNEEGWRTEWVVQGLAPQTNYTVYTVQNGVNVSGPIYFSTKSVVFSCSLLHGLPYCPSVSYSVPLPPPARGQPAHDSTTLPKTITEPLLSYLTNFTTSLLTFACGRDLYSPVQSCADCQRAYRKWLCSVSFPRCGEFSTATTAGTTEDGAQSVFAALRPQTSAAAPRNPHFPPFQNAYSALLPCIETCTAVDRACPDFMGFQCPVPAFNANQSYGVGYIDGGVGHEDERKGGSVGGAQDRWGNVWCSGS
ncbi:stretch-activated Ca2+-permeable channel component-domain-containing protein [Amylostereum chailletii]|nr:stretch-activated Ca2+-permeable channel component-domain-containing protein [Amylostereum chailletii]